VPPLFHRGEIAEKKPCLNVAGPVLAQGVPVGNLGKAAQQHMYSVLRREKPLYGLGKEKMALVGETGGANSEPHASIMGRAMGKALLPNVSQTWGPNRHLLGKGAGKILHKRFLVSGKIRGVRCVREHKKMSYKKPLLHFPGRLGETRVSHVGWGTLSRSLLSLRPVVDRDG